MKNSKLKLEDFLSDSLKSKQAIALFGGTGGGTPPPPLDPPPSGGDGTPTGPTQPPMPDLGG